MGWRSDQDGIYAEIRKSMSDQLWLFIDLEKITKHGISINQPIIKDKQVIKATEDFLIEQLEVNSEKYDLLENQIMAHIK